MRGGQRDDRGANALRLSDHRVRSAAYAAAIAARERGVSVVMVESGTVGGTCVNVGCVPSKALLAAAEARHAAQSAGRFPGIASGEGPVDARALIDGKDALVRHQRGAKYLDLASDYGWEIISGTATFTDGPALDVALSAAGTIRVEADRYLIATGAAPWAPVVEGLADSGYLTSTTAMELDTVPASMIVVGAGAVGLEMAQLFARLGTRVTLVEALDRVAPVEEPQISAALEQVLRGEGMTVHTGAALTGVRRGVSGHGITIGTSSGIHDLSADQLLIATGRQPLIAGLNPRAAGVETGLHGEIVIDDYQRSSNDRIWAAGDVTGAPQFVYVAAAQGTLAVDNMFNPTPRTLDYSALPRVTFTSPAVAAVGLTEDEAISAGIPVASRVLSLTQVPRASVARDARGLVKLVAHAETGRLLGAHVTYSPVNSTITPAMRPTCGRIRRLAVAADEPAKATASAATPTVIAMPAA
jgi:mercuric reductase